MRKLIVVFVCVFFLLFPTNVSAFISINSPSAILMDQGTAYVLFAYNEHERKYPAGLTKMMTAIVALDYLNPESFVVVGSEINNIPAGALRSGHQVGEHITVHNLLRGLMIQNGNDSGVVVALQTVRAQRNNNAVPFHAAEELFAAKMNARARELGAYNTHFVNPNGLHHEDHYTTAYDLALIARAFMEHPLLREIAEEAEFIGNSMDGFTGDIPYGARTVEHHWRDTNELISGGGFHYFYATGIRSGYTPQASACLAASASRNDVNLIAVVLGTQDPARWQDARALFEYGFATYAYRDVLEKEEFLKNVPVYNAMLGTESNVDIVAKEGFTALFSQAQLARLERIISFYEPYYELPEDGDYVLHAPVEIGDIVGTIKYQLDGQVIFEGPAISAGAIYARSLDSDMDFYIAFVRDRVFSVQALPFWLGLAGLLIGISGVSLAISERRRNRRGMYRR